MRALALILVMVVPVAAVADDLYVLNLWGVPGGEAVAMTAGPLPPAKCEHVRAAFASAHDLPIPPDMTLQVSVCIQKAQLAGRLFVPWHCVAQDNATDPREHDGVQVWLYGCVSVD